MEATQKTPVVACCDTRVRGPGLAHPGRDMAQRALRYAMLFVDNPHTALHGDHDDLFDVFEIYRPSGDLSRCSTWVGGVLVVRLEWEKSLPPWVS